MSFYYLLILSIGIQLLNIVVSVVVNEKNQITIESDENKCNLDTGCQHLEGTVCDPTLKRCVCRPDRPVRLSNGACLESRAPNEPCITSAQCLVKHSACYATDDALKHWVCQCRPDYYSVTTTTNLTTGGAVGIVDTPVQQHRCEPRVDYGHRCQQSNQCRNRMQCLTSDGGQQQQCVCADKHEYDKAVGDCRPVGAKLCATDVDGDQEWSTAHGKCMPKIYYSHRGSSGGGSGSRAGAGGRDSGSKGWFGNNPATRVRCYANTYFSISALIIILTI
ncbi:uncharacterized protein LOC128956963 [Oppia nitens]|uniref:uncharacterized protein LOC128956963 n=1 Tax=Oppia nitens TaxID=1686743 RepID=UPI0023D9DF02|nr:uncharacterized protein LOC128956963 [Oppia nitens]